MKRAFLCGVAVALMLFIFFGAFSFETRAIEMPQLFEESEALLLYHNESGTVLYEEAADREIPASCGARLLLGLIFAEHYENDLQKEITVDRRVTGLASSTLIPGLRSGETLRAYELLAAMMIASSDDAAYALAFDYFEGDNASVVKTVALMNERAKALGAEKTLFYDLLGAQPATESESYSVSSARDLLKIAVEAQKNKTLTAVCALESYTIPKTARSDERILLTRNYLLSARRIPGYTYSDATGLVSFEGSTFGSCGIFTVLKGGRSYTCIISGGKERYDAFKSAKTLFDWGAKSFAYKKVLNEIEVLGEIKVTLSDDFDYLTVSPASALTAFLPIDVDLEKEIEKKVDLEVKSIKAPVNEGLIVGEVSVYYRGEQIGKCNLVTNGSLALSYSGYYFSLFRNFVSSPVFLVTTISLIAFFIIYILVNARVRYLRKTRPALFRMEEEDDAQEERNEKESAALESEKVKIASLEENKAEGLLEKGQNEKTEELSPTPLEESIKIEQEVEELRVLLEEAKKQEEEKQTARRFYDLEKDGDTEVGDKDDSRNTEGYEPNGWEKYLPK